MRYLLPLIFFLLTILPAQAQSVKPDRIFPFAIIGAYRADNFKAIETSLNDGWMIINGSTDFRLGTAGFKLVGKGQPANIVIKMTGRDPIYGKGIHPPAHTLIETKQITIFYEIFRLYSATNRARIIAHEWGHSIFKLPDEYGGVQTGIPEELVQRHCLMGYEYRDKEWTGRFCKNCQKVLEEVYNSTNIGG